MGAGFFLEVAHGGHPAQLNLKRILLVFIRGEVDREFPEIDLNDSLLAVLRARRNGTANKRGLEHSIPRIEKEKIRKKGKIVRKKEKKEKETKKEKRKKKKEKSRTKRPACSIGPPTRRQSEGARTGGP